MPLTANLERIQKNVSGLNTMRNAGTSSRWNDVRIVCQAMLDLVNYLGDTPKPAVLATIKSNVGSLQAMEGAGTSSKWHDIKVVCQGMVDLVNCLSGDSDAPPPLARIKDNVSELCIMGGTGTSSRYDDIRIVCTGLVDLVDELIVQQERSKKEDEETRQKARVTKECAEEARELVEKEAQARAAREKIISLEMSKLQRQIEQLIKEKESLERKVKETRLLLEQEKLELERKQNLDAEQVQKALAEVNSKIALLTTTAETTKNRLEKLTEEVRIEKSIRESQAQLLQALDSKLQAVVGIDVDRVLLAELQTAREMELEKTRKRSALLDQEDYPLLKVFYLRVQRFMNALLLVDEIKLTGEFATRDTTKKEKALSVAKVLGRVIPLLGLVTAVLDGGVKAYAEKQKQRRALYTERLPVSVLSREAMVEEIAFGLCERYERQLKKLNFATDEEEEKALTKLAEVAALRMRGYLLCLQSEGSVETQEEIAKHQRLFETDLVTALIRAVRLVKLSGDRKKKIPLAAAKSALEVRAVLRPDSPPLNLRDWTMHGFFSQSGIRTTTPRRRRFAFEAPSESALKKKRTANGVYYTDAQRYGYANGTEEDAKTAKMEMVEVRMYS